MQTVLVKYGEREAPNNGASKKDDDGASADGKILTSGGGGTSPNRNGDKASSSSSSSKPGMGNGNYGGPGGVVGRGKGKKDWVRYDGAAMLLSSAGWSDDEDEEKEELITSEIEKFRQKQVRLEEG